MFLLQQWKRFLLNGLAEAVDKHRDHVSGRRRSVADSDIRAAPPLPQAFAAGLVVKGNVDTETAWRNRPRLILAVGVENAAAGRIEKIKAHPRRIDARLDIVVAQFEKPIGPASGP